MRDPDEIPIWADDVTTAEAAAMAGVKPGVVRMWANRQHLTAASRDDQGRPLYRALDVAKAEAVTRRRAGR